MNIANQLLLKKSTIIITCVLDFLIGLALLVSYFESKVIAFFSAFNVSPQLVHDICYISGSIGIAVIPLIFGWIAYRIFQDNSGSSHTILIGGVVGLAISFFLYIVLFWIIGAICLILFIPLSIFTIIYNKTHNEEL